MNPFVALALASALAVSALFIALVLFLRAICIELEHVGGPTTRFVRPHDYLGKIRLGVRAIEVQTGALPGQVTRLNTTLGSILGGLRAIDERLGALIAAVGRQGGR